jgi:hypothetical protein
MAISMLTPAAELFAAPNTNVETQTETDTETYEVTNPHVRLLTRPPQLFLYETSSGRLP